MKGRSLLMIERDRLLAFEFCHEGKTHLPSMQMMFRRTRISWPILVLVITLYGISSAYAGNRIVTVAPKIVFYADGFTRNGSHYPNYYHDSAQEALDAAQPYWDYCEPNAYPGDQTCYTAVNLRPYVTDGTSNGSYMHYITDLQYCYKLGCYIVTVTGLGAIDIHATLKCPSEPAGYTTSQYPIFFSLTQTNSSSTARTFECSASVPDVQPCPDCDARGNPVHPGTGQKVQLEVDYAVPGSGLHFERTYRSTNGYFASVLTQGVVDNTVAGAGGVQCYGGIYDGDGSGVTYGYCFPYVGAGTQTYQLLTEDGRIAQFSGSPGAIVSSADVNDKLSQRTNSAGNIEWVVQRTDNSVEIYNAQGTLVHKTSVDGRNDLTLTYSDSGTPSTIAPRAGLLIGMTDQYGKQLSFTYDAKARVISMIDPSGHTTGYAYDSGGNLSSVMHADTLTRTYFYESANVNGGSACTNPINGIVISPFLFPLTGISDESNSRFSTYNYDCTVRAISTEHSGGVNKYTFSYSNSNVTTEIDPLGTTRTDSYSQILTTMQPVGVTQPASSGVGTVSRSVTYDGQGNVLSRTDFVGDKTCYANDSTRNLETIRVEGIASGSCPANPSSYSIPTNTSQRKISTQWHPDWRLVVRKAEPNRVTSYVYNGQADPTNGALTSCAPTNALLPNSKPIAVLCKRIEQETSDSTGTLGFSATLTSQLAKIWTYTYDGYGRVLTADGPRTDVSDVATYTYYTCATGNECGQVQTITDAAGHVTTYNTYNAHGQPLTITDPDGVVTTLAYDLRQRVTSRTVGSEVTSFSYWPTGLLKKVTLADGSFLSYIYDNAHRLTEIDDAAGNRVVYTLDAMGNHTAENVYDPSNALARTRSQVFNSLSQLWKDVKAAGTSDVTTTFGYDNNGNPTAINEPLARNTANTYDALNRLSQVTDPANGITKYGYDANDNLTTVTDPRNLQTTYGYNGLGDLKQLISPDTGTTTNTYDEAGNLKTSMDARGKTATYSYDALNRVTQVSYSDQTINFTYDVGANAAGRLSSLSDGSGSTSWGYTSLGRVSSKAQTVGSVSKSVSYGYNAAGQLTSITTPTGQVIGYGYTNNQVTSITVNGNPLLSQVLYEPFGPTRGWTWGNGTLTDREYDQDGQLTNNDSAGATALTYNADGTVHSVTQEAPASLGPSGSTTLNTATTSNQLTSSTGQLARTYSYDAAGHTLSDGTRTFTYDAAGRLITASGSGGSGAYVYNALGQRVKKAANGATTYFVYDEAGRLIGEYDQTGALLQELVWLNDIPVASIRTNTSGTGVGVFYVHTNRLNAPTKLTEPTTNTIVWRWDFDPYGNGVANEDPDGNGAMVHFNLRFPGQYFDQETGLSYNYFRDYDPTTGRYVESDLIGLKGGINTYAYGWNNPLGRTDQYGLAPGDICGVCSPGDTDCLLYGGNLCFPAKDARIRSPSQFPYHGNWCGPYWTGGHEGTWDDILADKGIAGEDMNVKAPTDALDSACMTHDMCYSNCRKANPCDREARRSCMKTCDTNLAAGAAGSRLSLLWLQMRFGDPDPEENAQQCNESCKK